jgi:hypothetical protein
MTAVEWLSEQLLNLDIEFDSILINRANYWVKRNNILDQAKEMEKQQSYSDEEVTWALLLCSNKKFKNSLEVKEWFEQFKKK